MGTVDHLRWAREAYERRDWMAAYDALSDLDPSALRGEDFARLAIAAQLVGRRNDAVQAMQRSYRIHLDAGDHPAAAMSAFWLAMSLSQAGEPTVGAGWRAKGERVLAGGDDVVERGYLLCHEVFSCIHGGEHARARELAVDVEAYGKRFDNADLTAMSLNCRGRLQLYAGDVAAGLHLLDEAMATVTSGELSPIFAGNIYCSVVEACQEICDIGRLSDWTRVLTSWCDTQPDLLLFTGQCAVHRGQIMLLRGEWAAAIEEFDRAVGRYLLVGTPTPAGSALAERAVVLQLQGDLDGAHESFARANSYGYESQPAQALLWLDQGRVDAAVTTIRRLLEEPRDPVHRAQLLAGAVEILLAGSATDEAAAVASELASVAARFGFTALKARASYATARVSLARGDPGAAVSCLKESAHRWAELGAVYEVARCRVGLGQAYVGLGDHDSAAEELAMAESAFRGLGARPAERAAAQVLRPVSPGGLTAREIEVLQHVASGLSNAEIARSLVLSEKTVARHLSNIFAKLDVSTRTAAAAYAFRHHLT
ncbi:helix-turn-helix transcriptional regulator [Luteipulveratus mongoliensis]|uniref:helix-turn-helix transcriptional regulator n=1 Tax=Luteipulveratus mongoliensis TaxID=571913 RepID=UPI00069715F6|nr:helix-turn-helix transcriptional regulator [Luteipulveratus mongoliensis]